MIHDTVFNELKLNTKRQLHQYPYMMIKDRFKLIIKSIIKKRKLFINDKFFWPNGLMAISLEWVHRIEGNDDDLKTLKAYYNKWIKKGIPMINLDYTINGYSLIYLYKITKDKKYLKTIEHLVDYLKRHIKTADGSLPYRKAKKNKVFVDSLGMICPFLCRYGAMNNDNTTINLAITQLTNFLKFGMNEELCLPYHGYDSSNNTKLGIIGWGRGTGWMLIGLVDSLEFISKSHAQYEFLCEALNKIVQEVLYYQKENGAFSWLIPAIDGYSDTSSTSMINYAIKRGIMLNLISETYLKNTQLALNYLYSKIDNGFVQECSAECKGLGMYPQKYGNYPWAQGPTTSLIAISTEQLGNV